MDFKVKLDALIARHKSLLCVGLDPDPQKTIVNKLFDFNKKIIYQTNEFVCAYKPNIAFYEAVGLAGFKELKKTIGHLKKNFPEIPIILDAKRADIPNTARMYAKSIYEYWGVDATTVYPHLGLDSIEPFLEYGDKLTILILKTSNSDSVTFQDIKTKSEPYYLKMAKEINKWKRTNIGIFVGATYPKQLKELRAIFPDKIFLSAGFGAQSADIKKAVKAGVDKNGANIMFNASRSIIYSTDPSSAAQKLRDEINEYR